MSPPDDFVKHKFMLEGADLQVTKGARYQYGAKRNKMESANYYSIL